MSIRYNYNRQFSPPAPCVYVSVARPDESQSLDTLPAQVDTGADVTVIPSSVVDRLQLVQTGQREIIGFDGRLSIVSTYFVVMSIQGGLPALERVVSSPEERIVLLGRDVLNRYRILFDGPGLTLDINV